MDDALSRGGSDRRRYRGREDEARRGRTDRITDHRIGRYVATHDAKALGQYPFDNVDVVHDPIALGNASATQAVETDGMHFVEVGQGPEFCRQIADAPDRGDIAIH